MAYSAVIQPRLLRFMNCGTLSSTVAVATTRVWPCSQSTEPGTLRT